MAAVSLFFTPEEGLPPASNPATYDVVSGTNFPVSSLDFDAATDESIFFKFRAVNYGSGNLTLALDWYADTASTGSVVWGAQIACITPDTDSQDIETKAFATANSVTDTHLGTTGQRLHRALLTLSNLDGLAADDWCVLKIFRDADHGSDDLAGDACLVGLTVSYPDT